MQISDDPLQLILSNWGGGGGHGGARAVQSGNLHVTLKNKMEIICGIIQKCPYEKKSFHHTPEAKAINPHDIGNVPELHSPKLVSLLLLSLFPFTL